MASVLRFQELTPTLTPPPSDRGECDDTAMLNSETYVPEVFYPSPAPSLTHQHSTFLSQSPDLSHSDSTYETEEDSQHSFLFSSHDPQIFANSSSDSNGSLYSTTMPYPSYEPISWMQYSNYPSTVAMFPYSGEDSTNLYSNYVPHAPSIIPPIPQVVTGASFNFNEPIARPQNSTSFIRTYSTATIRSQSPHAQSTASASVSSRSSSPNMSKHMSTGSQSSRRASLVPHRQSNSSLHAYGIPIRSPDSSTVQAWRCAYPNCTSRAVFTRGCDLRKHYNRHSKHLFCRVDGCPQSEAACVAAAQQQAIQTGAEASDPSSLAITGGFSSKKDRARHEAKHNPGIKCEWQGPNGEECGRVFSRMDNMKDHVRRIHNKGQAPTQQQSNRKKSLQ